MSAFKKSALKASIALAATGALFGTGFSPALATVNEDGSKTITVVGISDFHGHIEQAPNLACQLNNIRNENPDTLFVSNGDNIGGSAYVSSIAKDKPTLEILNAMGLDVSSAGNHEFDQGYDDLTGRVAEIAQFNHLTANIAGADHESTQPYEIFTVADGVSIAFVGGTTVSLPEVVSPKGIVGLELLDPIRSMDKVAADLKDNDPANGEADIVIGLLHEGNEITKQLGKDFDAAFSGHTHQLITSATATGAPVIEPGYYGLNFGRLEISISKDGEVSIQPSTHEVRKFDDEEAAGCIDPQILEMYNKAAAEAEELGKVEVGKITGSAKRAVNAAGSENRGSESTASNFIATSYYLFGNSISNVDLAIMNPGGVRANIDQDEDGVLTAKEIHTVQPFGNTLGTVELTAPQLKAVLEQQWRDNDSRPVLALGMSENSSFIYDPEAAPGNKITDIFINSERIDFEDTDTKYTVISNNFLLDGGDGFTALNDATNRKDTGWVDVEATKSVFKDLEGPWDVSQNQVSVGINGPRTLKPGQEVTYKLSSLSMTRAEEQGQKFKVTSNFFNSDDIEIDNTVVDKNPETGQATVTFTVDESATGGEHELNFIGDKFSASIKVNIEAPAPADDSDDDSDNGQGAGNENPDEKVDGDDDTDKDEKKDSKDQTQTKQPMKLSKAESKRLSRAKLSNTGFAGAGFAAAAVAMIIAGTMATALPRRKR